MQQPAPASPSRPIGRRLLAALGAMLVIGAVIYLSTLRLGGTAAPSPGGSFFPLGSATEGIAIGQAAPDFVAADGEPLLHDLDGRPVQLADFTGRPLWIVFWATWCTPCQEEAADIRSAFHAHADKELAVLAIDIQEPADAVREYVSEHDLDYAIGLDPTGEVKDLYGSWGLPSHFFLDAGGVIRDRSFGQLTAPLMEQRLRSILGS
jgi:peroxiredoxin